MRIIEQLTGSTFVVELDNRVLDTEAHIQIAHDYIGYSEQGSLQTKDSSVHLWGKYKAYGNGIYWTNHVQIPIRVAQQLILPMLLESDYMKPEHLVDSDGPIYNYNNDVVHYYNTETKTHMVAILVAGDTNFNHVTLQFYNRFIKHQFHDSNTN